MGKSQWSKGALSSILHTDKKGNQQKNAFFDRCSVVICDICTLSAYRQISKLPSLDYILFRRFVVAVCFNVHKFQPVAIRQMNSSSALSRNTSNVFFTHCFPIRSSISFCIHICYVVLHYTNGKEETNKILAVPTTITYTMALLADGVYMRATHQPKKEIPCTHSSCERVGHDWSILIYLTESQEAQHNDT